MSASLPAGGYEVPTSESARAERLLNDKFDAGGMSIVFAITGPADVDSAAVRARGQAIVDALRALGLRTASRLVLDCAAGGCGVATFPPIAAPPWWSRKSPDLMAKRRPVPTRSPNL